MTNETNYDTVFGKMAVEHGECPLDPDELKLKIETKFGKPLFVGTHPYV